MSAATKRVKALRGTSFESAWALVTESQAARRLNHSLVGVRVGLSPKILHIVEKSGRLAVSAELLQQLVLSV